FTGRDREALLEEAKLSGQGRLPSWWEGRAEVEPWPCDGLLPPEYTLAELWRQEWELLGFLPGPPLMSLARACVPGGLADSRTLGGLAGQRVRLAGLVAAERGGEQFTVEDEWGLVEIEARAGMPEGLGLLVLAEGRVADRHGVPVLVEARLSRP